MKKNTDRVEQIFQTSSRTGVNGFNYASDGARHYKALSLLNLRLRIQGYKIKTKTLQQYTIKCPTVYKTIC